jgi:ADP-heptose:LPS heptosyltransferase
MTIAVSGEESPLRRLRRLLAPPGSWRERLGQAVYGPIVDSLPRPWQLRLRPHLRVVARLVTFETPASEAPGRPPIARLIVLKLDHIGDMVTGMRAMRMLRDSFPEAHMTLVCASWNAAIARRLGLFDDIVTFDFFTPMNRDWLAASADLRPLYDGIRALALPPCDLAVDLRHDADTRPCLYRIDARYRAGYYAPVEAGVPHLDLMLPHSEGMPVSETVSLSLQAELRLDVLASAVGVAFGPRPPHPLAAARSPGAAARPYAVLGIGAGDPIRCWPIDRYAAIGRALVEARDFDIVIVGGKAESADAARLAAALPAGRAREVIAMPVAELPDLLAGAALCVCNGSGVSHMAAATGTPTVCVLGGTTRMEVWYPAGPHVIALGGRTSCQPCGLRHASECEWNVACLAIVTPGDVLAACDRLLLAVDGEHEQGVAGVLQRRGA